jgi:hypothetical protein
VNLEALAALLLTVFFPALIAFVVGFFGSDD